jgi:hypothetical protein
LAVSPVVADEFAQADATPEAPTLFTTVEEIQAAYPVAMAGMLAADRRAEVV